MRSLAEPLLYRHLNLWNCPTRSLYLFRSLIAREDLCKHVREFVPADYHLKADRLFDTLKWLVLKQKEKYKRGQLYLQLATQVAARLKHAESISTSTRYPPDVQILSGLSNVKQFRTTNALSFPGVLKSLFNAIPNVTHLELPLDMPPLYGFKIHPHHAPLLQELVCPAAFAPFLVPGRPVHRLLLRWPRWGDGPNVSQLLEQMSRSSRTIKRLGLLIGSRVNLQADIEDIFSATARFLPDVEEVTVWLEFRKSQTDSLEGLLREVGWVEIWSVWLVKLLTDPLLALYVALGKPCTLLQASHSRLQRFHRIRGRILRSSAERHLWGIYNHSRDLVKQLSYS